MNDLSVDAPRDAVVSDEAPERARECTADARAQFHKQFTPELMKRLTVFVAQRDERLGINHGQAADQVHAAIVKTLAGSRRWDPSRVDLGGHLLGILSSQLSSDLKHGDKFEHVSLDDDDACYLESVQRETEDALLAAAAGSIETAIAPVWAFAMSELRRAARDEPDVRAILGAYERGACLRRDVIRVARLQPAVYERAHARLIELASHLDAEIREAILDAMR